MKQKGPEQASQEQRSGMPEQSDCSSGPGQLAETRRDAPPTPTALPGQHPPSLVTGGTLALRVGARVRATVTPRRGASGPAARGALLDSVLWIACDGSADEQRASDSSDVTLEGPTRRSCCSLDSLL